MPQDHSKVGVSITRAQFDDLRRRLDREAPNRALAVVRLLAAATGTAEEPNRKQRREQRRRQHRHPARVTAREKRRQWHDPSPREALVRDLNRMMREEITKSAEESGEIVGPLYVTARYAVPIMLEDFGLGPEHEYPLQHWVLAKLGDVLRDPEIQGYLAWREECLTDISDSAAA